MHENTTNITGQKESKFSLETENLNVSFSGRNAISDISIKIRYNSITAIIGPSGCGKSTFLRSLNFMHDLTQGSEVTGSINVLGKDITDYDSTEIRRKVGMVFQKPNPFPTMSVFENVIAGLSLNGFRMMRNKYNDIVEEALSKAGLWDEVKDRLKVSAMSLSGGQQQRLCIARTLAVSPEIVLMDEPTSALDPKSTARIEETIHEIKSKYTIIIVTHNMQQAARASDYTAFFYLGKLIEHSKTRNVFTSPKEKLTEEYITGKFG
ncbi:MAG: phosphate ABC transporter ATP-binding protein PstB [Ignavibacteriae bacterium]|jgi:phosphate transport system ATP-binding protein|nr:phosphate ABC transporter ATP-binding protein PstB [Ignavibacteriota bacterium]